MSTYPFDSTGTLPSNRITNEPHAITEINGVEHAYVIPKAAPFYERSMVVVDLTTSKILKHNEDYYFAYPFKEATDKTGQPVSGGLAFTNKDGIGNYLLTYQTLGEPFVDNADQLIVSGLELLDNLLFVDWDQIVDVPEVFPPTVHLERLDSVEGMSDFLAKMQSLVEAVSAPKRITVDDVEGLDLSFYVPLVESMASMAAGLADVVNSQNLTVASSHTAANPGSDDLISPPTGIWHPTNLTVSVPQDGLYKIEFDCLAKGFSQSEGMLPVSCRWALNGSNLSASRLSHTKHNLKEGDVVSLELMVERTVERLAFNGITYGCSLSIAKIRSNA